MAGAIHDLQVDIGFVLEQVMEIGSVIGEAVLAMGISLRLPEAVVEKQIGVVDADNQASEPLAIGVGDAATYHPGVWWLGPVGWSWGRAVHRHPGQHDLAVIDLPDADI